MKHALLLPGAALACLALTGLTGCALPAGGPHPDREINPAHHTDHHKGHKTEHRGHHQNQKAPAEKRHHG